MAIVKATYTKNKAGAKASIRYIQHRPGKDGTKTTRTLFTSDQALGRWQAYTIIDNAAKGNLFFRFVISPDPHAEDTKRDLHLREITERTMQTLSERVQQTIQWVAAEHDDHAPHRHVHVVAVVPGKLYPQDFKALRYTATETALEQRQQRDLIQAHDNRLAREEEAQWE